MTKRVRSAVLVSLILIASAAMATADIVRDLTVSLSQAPCIPFCNFGLGDQGSPAVGDADFTLNALPWTFSFMTGEALSWSQTDSSYMAIFGEGGVFNMTGPYGLTFTGVVTSGEAGYMGDIGGVEVTFSGQWSDGLKGSGDASVFWNPGFQGYIFQTLDTRAVAPEPTSIALMASGVLGIWGCRKRSWSKMKRP